VRLHSDRANVVGWARLFVPNDHLALGTVVLCPTYAGCTRERARACADPLPVNGYAVHRPTCARFL